MFFLMFVVCGNDGKNEELEPFSACNTYTSVLHYQQNEWKKFDTVISFSLY